MLRYRRACLRPCAQGEPGSTVSTQKDSVSDSPPACSSPFTQVTTQSNQRSRSVHGPTYCGSPFIQVRAGSSPTVVPAASLRPSSSGLTSAPAGAHSPHPVGTTASSRTRSPGPQASRKQQARSTSNSCAPRPVGAASYRSSRSFELANVSGKLYGLGVRKASRSTGPLWGLGDLPSSTAA